MPKRAAAAPAHVLGIVASMTGFARAEGEAEGLAWSWELKSVNGKSLDLRFRLPAGFDALELPLRALIGERLKRGSVSVSLAVARTGAGAGLQVNRAVLDQVLALAHELGKKIKAAPPSIDGLLALRGVLEGGEALPDAATRERREASLLAGCRKAIDALGIMRRAEGARLGAVLSERLGEIASLAAAAEASAAAQPAAIRARLKSLVDALNDAVPSIPEERLVQEAALMVARADIREELDRLAAHIAAARELLAEGGAVGRRLDFLCQELNREANTLCSKSADVELTRIGLELKAAIEQLREQVQNIE
ncbi:MAG TPA: YicC/YloC family endoribonuclease [Stellaceae bacterium]|nr:YicC/YloC family endoribonuclease [Stellaceae bacterium]